MLVSLYEAYRHREREEEEESFYFKREEMTWLVLAYRYIQS